MAQAADLRRPFHLQLLPMQSQPHQILNVEIVQHGDGDQTLYQQNLMSLGADVQLPEICDARDITIAVLEGTGSLIIQAETVTLEPGLFVFIPANISHRLETRSRLVFLLNRCMPDRDTTDLPWVINL